MDYKIVPLADRHVSELADIEAALFSMPWSEKAFSDLLKHDYCHYLVAEENGEPVGFAGMTLLGDEGDIDKVMVEPGHQRQGIADAMLEALFSLGAEKGAAAYTLEVRASNTPAIRLYEKHGFVSEGVRPRFYEKPTEDALIMWKRS
ncbi:MAG: ribosomal protein S18-alanine N-acetyltransferase [Lachnospiraceae bacterium]|nr:ribosomal protein S18-alanine N-acetyltransferase [Lachnospiraceae bacterium]MBR3508155.1 ribosomal protein S18-alanine N-acetyltransferase [Lachnospiraceae bacterium]MBR4608648.1 ribosomal protein S18-alanine N-acetyltransferase [Lachnospiraceae bacterium]